ncbi:zinc transporter binding subunit ZevA [Rodentibacter myodis]|uniref:ABC transporter n=1 Tax=Rodentibacter myodis TaxID=1907939 RepID=A0A1V3JQB3_9PAST|nr:zinc transporter binding subunit ZevA [Rodentibacter myodis]OOF58992.1 ABC transporter [Rodentibacter myodis]
MEKLFLLVGMFSASIALAHPHAFIEMQSALLIEEDKLVGFSMKWTLDEASSAAVLYDMQQAESKIAQQKLIDDVMNNIVNEHYFTHLFDKNNRKIRYKKQVQNYGVNIKGMYLQYYFDFLLVHPQPLRNNAFTMMTYDRTYYVSMVYPEGKSAVNFSGLPLYCKGEVLAPNVNKKMQSYAASLDKTQKYENDTLGVIFAQKVNIQCE